MLTHSGIFLLATLCRPVLTFAGKASTLAMPSMHNQVAKQAMHLAQGRNVKLTILFPTGALGNIKPIGEMFTQLTGIHLEYSEVPYAQINTHIMLSAMAGNAEFDLALPATFALPDLIESSAVENLDRFVEKYEPVHFRDDILYSLGDYYKNHFYGYQTDGDTYLMFYNKAWMRDKTENRIFKEKYGRSLNIPKTWEELDQMIAFFHRPEKGMYGGSLFRTPDHIAWEWWMRFHAKGYYPLDDSLKPQINNDAGVKALEELIHVSQFLEPKVDVNGLFENFESFCQGNKFCNIGWGGSQKYFNRPSSKVRGNLVYSSAPGGIVNDTLIRTPFFNWGWNYTVSSQSKEKEIAYLFSLFACSPYVSTVAIREPSGYFDPFRKNHYQDPEIINTYTKEFLKAHQESMGRCIPDFYLNGQGEYMGALKENLISAYQRKQSPKDALDLTAKQWQRITSKIGAESQKEQWQFLKSSYPSELRDILV